jgi:predicted TIM-barrel fold metal-dependent hydrolase
MAAPSPLTRRAFMRALGGAALTAFGGAQPSTQVRASERARGGLIDTHHHFLPPEYVRIVGRDAIGRPAPGGAPDWDVAKSLRTMDDNGITAAVVSVSTPGIWFGDLAQAGHLARLCNEFAAQMVADYPGRFGFFATLPLPDAQGSLAELQHAAENLKCDGIALMTNYGDRYLGDSGFDTVFAEINRRGLVVYVHPYVCSCDLGVLPGIPSAMIEFPHSTTRALVGLLSSQTLSRYTDIRWIFSHAGGTVPFLVNRMVSQGKAIGRGGWEQPLRRCYYDTASSTNPAAFGPLLQLVNSKQVLFGTDYPFVAGPAITAAIAGLHALDLSQRAIADIEAANARRLFPRLARQFSVNRVHAPTAGSTSPH